VCVCARAPPHTPPGCENAPGGRGIVGAREGVKLTPTARSLDLLRQSGYLAEPVERWLPGANLRRDLFHVGDVLAVHPHRQPAFLLVQATTRGHVQARLDKARCRPELAVWLRAGGAFEVWGWFCTGKRWDVRRVGVQAGDLAAVPLTRTPRRTRTPRQRDLFAGDLAGADRGPDVNRGSPNPPERQ
jgi:hypothetical protein